MTDPIDWSRIDELQGEVGANDFAEIAALFVAELREAACALGQTAGTERSAALHAMRGLSLNLGFHGVAEACRRAESGGPCDPDAILALCEKCEVILRTRFPDLPA